MGDVPVAAYDPIFFLHHCNIDRLYAIRQTLHSKNWFRLADIHKDNGTWSLATGHPDTQCTQLAPFRPNLSGIYYTPDTVRDWMQFGYTYPELQPWNYETANDYVLSVYTDIAKKYRVTANEIKKSVSLTQDPLNAQDPLGALVPGRSNQNKGIIVHHDYIINVRYGKYDLGGFPYEILLYLRQEEPVPLDPQDPPHLIAPPFSGKIFPIGSVYNFSTATGPQGTNTNCANCAVQQANETLSTAQIPFTSILIKVAQDSACDVNTIAPDSSSESGGMVKFLEGRLTWKVFKKGGEEVRLTSLPNLRVSVAVGTAEHNIQHDHIPPIYEKYQVKKSITHGYLGGLQRNESF